MLLYIIKSITIQAVLLLFYKLLLEKENMHTFKRFYLLFSVIASIGIPLITITTYIEPVSGNFEPLLISSSEEVSETQKLSFIALLSVVTWTIYALGVLFFSLKFLKNLGELILKIKTNPRIKNGKITSVLLSEKVDPHTFFRFIFLNRKKYENKLIPKEVMIHEKAHARQKHSLDILFMEVLQIIFWINPLIILLKDAVKLNHEFLADSEVLKKGIQTAGYQYTLLSFSSGYLHSDLVNPINYSSIKKRFTVMKTHTSKKTIWAKGLLLLPLLGILIYSCSTREELEKANSDPAFQNQSWNKPTSEMIREYNHLARSYNSKGNNLIEITDYSKMRDIYDLMSPEQKKTAEIFPEVEIIEVVEDAKITPQMITKHNRMVKYYNSIPEEAFEMKQADANRIMYIRSLMTTEQKYEAEKIEFKILPPPPPLPPSPPAPPTFEKLLADRAIFYYEGKLIEPQKAREMVEDQKKLSVEITYENQERPVVKLTDKEGL